MLYSPLSLLIYIPLSFSESTVYSLWYFIVCHKLPYTWASCYCRIFYLYWFFLLSFGLFLPFPFTLVCQTPSADNHLQFTIYTQIFLLMYKADIHRFVSILLETAAIYSQIVLIPAGCQIT